MPEYRVAYRLAVGQPVFVENVVTASSTAAETAITSRYTGAIIVQSEEVVEPERFQINVTVPDLPVTVNVPEQPAPSVSVSAVPSGAQERRIRKFELAQELVLREFDKYAAEFKEQLVDVKRIDQLINAASKFVDRFIAKEV